MSGRSRESLREWAGRRGREEREAEDFLRSGEGAAAVPRCRVWTPASATQWEVVADCTRKEEVHLGGDMGRLRNGTLELKETRDCDRKLPLSGFELCRLVQYTYSCNVSAHCLQCSERKKQVNKLLSTWL